MAQRERFYYLLYKWERSKEVLAFYANLGSEKSSDGQLANSMNLINNEKTSLIF